MKLGVENVLKLCVVQIVVYSLWLQKLFDRSCVYSDIMRYVIYIIFVILFLQKLELDCFFMV